MSRAASIPLAAGFPVGARPLYGLPGYAWHPTSHILYRAQRDHLDPLDWHAALPIAGTALGPWHDAWYAVGGWSREISAFTLDDQARIKEDWAPRLPDRRFEVSSHGRVWDRRKKHYCPTKLCRQPNGVADVPKVRLATWWLPVADVVAVAFLGPPNDVTSRVGFRSGASITPPNLTWAPQAGLCPTDRDLLATHHQLLAQLLADPEVVDPKMLAIRATRKPRYLRRKPGRKLPVGRRPNKPARPKAPSDAEILRRAVTR